MQARMNIPNKCLKAYYSRDLITRATTTSSQIAPPLSHYLKILYIASNAVKREIEAHTILCANYYVEGNGSQFIYWTCQKTEYELLPTEYYSYANRSN